MSQQSSPDQGVQANSTALPVTLTAGHVQVHLPFGVDPQALSRQLLREGYPLAHDPDTPDTQGWGPDFDPNGYYPLWVFPDPVHRGRSVFAFYPHPEDVVDRAGHLESVQLGERSRATIDRWVPVLTSLQSERSVTDRETTP